MIDFLVVAGLLLLIPGAVLVVLHYLDNVEDIERREIQKLLGDCFHSK